MRARVAGQAAKYDLKGANRRHGLLVNLAAVGRMKAVASDSRPVNRRSYRQAGDVKRESGDAIWPASEAPLLFSPCMMRITSFAVWMTHESPSRTLTIRRSTLPQRDDAAKVSTDHDAVYVSVVTGYTPCGSALLWRYSLDGREPREGMEV